MSMLNQNIGALCNSAFGTINNDVTGGGSGDEAAIPFTGIDATGLGSVKVVVAYNVAGLTGGATLSLKLGYQLSTDNGVGDSWDTEVTIQDTEVVATADGNYVKEYDIDILSVGKKYIRFVATPSLSAASDTANITGVVIRGGKNTQPMTASSQNYVI